MSGKRAIVICGLPESGKTTFLAALWHVVTAREISTKLRLHSLRDGDATHLNEIAARWRNARVQERTKAGRTKLVSMDLTDGSSSVMRLTFPDVSGESYRRMWEERECDKEMAHILSGDTGILLFVHGDRIDSPEWVTDVAALSTRMGLELPLVKPVPWHPRLAPTQVQVVDLLQLLCAPPLGTPPRRLGIVLSAWDKVAPEGRTPTAFLAERMPLLDQWLKHAALAAPVCVFGVSAQGGDYEPDAEVRTTTPWSPEQVETLRGLDRPSDRVLVVGDGLPAECHDITEPITWLTA
jgi:hypothetical protein